MPVSVKRPQTKNVGRDTLEYCVEQSYGVVLACFHITTQQGQSDEHHCREEILRVSSYLVRRDNPYIQCLNRTPNVDLEKSPSRSLPRSPTVKHKNNPCALPKLLINLFVDFLLSLKNYNVNTCSRPMNDQFVQVLNVKCNSLSRAQNPL